MNYEIIAGDCVDVLKTLPAGSVQTCVTSPPYFGLRDYGHDGQIGLEETPDAYVAKLVDVFREVRRVLRDDGTLWLNLGDSYCGYKGDNYNVNQRRGTGEYSPVPASHMRGTPQTSGVKSKDLIGIPWMVAFALRADGWYLRSDIIWCLSGGTYVYARTQKGDIPMMIRDLARLNPATVQLWNGERWTQLLGMSKSVRQGDELELVLRSGERISCTPTHRFPTRRGLLDASQIQVGDVLERCQLPEPELPLVPEHLGDDAAWFAGLYIAEGNRDEKTIQISGHIKETERLERVQRIAAAYGGSARVYVDGNKMNIRVFGRMLHAIIDCLVAGEGAKKKGFHPNVWRYGNTFLSSMLDGYLSGDGHWDAPNNRWRLGFTRNYNLERDLRTVCARLGLRLTLNMTSTAYNGGTVPTFKGEIRMERSGHHNQKDMGEVVEIRKARCREVYDLGVADEPHVFALASGILTHNSKPNPMPESVTDRPTKAHEYIFLLSKSASYYYDAEAIKESSVDEESYKGRRPRNAGQMYGIDPSNYKMHGSVNGDGKLRHGQTYETRNRRSVWTVTTKPYRGAHFATFPPDLREPCILAGSKPGDTVLDPFCGSGTTLAVALKYGRCGLGVELNEDYISLAHKRIGKTQPMLLEVTA
jgi:DNA modification methylase